MQLQELDGEDEEQTESRTNCQTVHSSINNTLSVTQNGSSGNNQVSGVRSPSTNSSSFRNVSFRVWKWKKNNANVNPVVKIFVIVKTNIRKPCNFYVLDDLVHT